MMNSNLPIKYKKGLFDKIKKFLNRLFRIEKESGNNITIVKQSNNSEETESFKENIKSSETNKRIEEITAKRTIINMVEENQEVLEKLSTKNLMNLTNMYDEIIQENNRKIELLKKKAI